MLAERSVVSFEMAVHLGRFCGNYSGLWLRMQIEYDLSHAEQKLHDEVEQIPRHAAVRATSA